jgi:hypothetical protein
VNWIDVNDRMPDDDTIVLIHAPDANEPIWLGYHDGGDGWRLAEGFMARVTHWMELPKPPGGGGQ